MSKMLNLNLDDYKEEGLYLILPDSTHLDLTKTNIEKLTKKYWEDPEEIPENVKEAVGFKRCPFCPLRDKGDFCDALRPTLPFLDIVDRFISHDKVTALYKDEKGLLYISDTTMQQALQYVSIVSLIRYCQIGRRYLKYYFEIVPLIAGKDVAIRLYLNIYWIHKGKQGEIDKIIKEFQQYLRATSANQVKRLSLICKNDVFMNAFVSTQVATEFLSMDIEKTLEKAFNEFKKGTA